MTTNRTAAGLAGDRNRPPAAKDSLLDGALIRARRQELGISERQFAARLGVSQTILRGIESGTNHATVTLGEVQRLAHLLDVPAAQLLTTGPDEPAAPAGPPSYEEHLDRTVAVAGALLSGIGRPVPLQTVAELVGVPLEETDALLDELNARLSRVGLRAHRAGSDVTLRSDHDRTDMPALREAWRRHLARRSLDTGQAQLLLRAVRGEAVKTVTNDDRVRGGSLINAGILVRTPSGGYAAADDVTWSLML